MEFVRGCLFAIVFAFILWLAIVSLTLWLVPDGILG